MIMKAKILPSHSSEMSLTPTASLETAGWEARGNGEANSKVAER
jgi:hypothetical protein